MSISRTGRLIRGFTRDVVCKHHATVRKHKRSNKQRASFDTRRHCKLRSHNFLFTQGATEVCVATRGALLTQLFLVRTTWDTNETSTGANHEAWKRLTATGIVFTSCRCHAVQPGTILPRRQDPIQTDGRALTPVVVTLW